MGSTPSQGYIASFCTLLSRSVCMCRLEDLVTHVENSAVFGATILVGSCVSQHSCLRAVAHTTDRSCQDSHNCRCISAYTCLPVGGRVGLCSDCRVVLCSGSVVCSVFFSSVDQGVVATQDCELVTQAIGKQPCVLLKRAEHMLA